MQAISDLRSIYGNSSDWWLDNVMCNALFESRPLASEEVGQGRIGHALSITWAYGLYRDASSPPCPCVLVMLQTWVP